MMAETTGIEWCDRTWSPWEGCTKVSPACDHCYAEVLANRFGKATLWQGERRLTAASGWSKLPKWNAEAERKGRIFTVFPSICDPFDNQVPAEWRDRFWHATKSFSSLVWLLLTKRPQNIQKMLPADWGDGYLNVWLGATVENQAEAVRRIPHLLAVPAPLHFLSCEPLLEAVKLTDIELTNGRTLDALRAQEWTWQAEGVSAEIRFGRRVRWVICGGETGAGARLMSPDWARSLRNQCREAGVPYFHKQMTNKALIPTDLMVREFPDMARA